MTENNTPGYNIRISIRINEDTNGRLQYREAIAALGMSQVAAAAFLGVSPRTSRHWALGESPVPRAVSILLRLMVSRDINPRDVQ